MNKYGGVTTTDPTTPFPIWNFGWKNDPAAVQMVLATLPYPRFADAAANLIGSGVGKNGLLYLCAQKVLGGDMPAQQQPRGTCVSRGWSRAVDYVQLVEIALRNIPEEFAYVSHAVVYGMSKEIGGDMSYQDGAVGAWAAKAVAEWGVCTNEETGDVEAGSDDLAVEWGARGVPKKFKDAAKDNLVKVTTLVTRAEDARDMLVNGYPLSVCSNQGFTMTRDADGRCKPQGSWSHCVLPETLIAGPTFRRADEVKVGDQVYGHDGSPHAVTEVYRRPFRGTLARIKAAGIPAVTFTDEHPVLVYRRARRANGAHKRAALAVGTSVAPTDAPTHYAAKARYEPAWVRAQDVRPGDRLLTPRLKSQPPCPSSPVEPSEELAWLFGFYIGDGYATANHKVVLTLSLNDPAERVVDAFRLLGVEATVKDHKTFRRVYAYSSKLANQFLEWFGSGSENKSIPAWLMTWDAKSLLDGLIQSDGCDYKGRRIYTSVSPILAEQVRLLVIAIGERPSVTIKQPGKGAYANGKTQHVIQWTPGSTDRKVTNAAGFAMYVVQSVLLIPHEGEVFNYEVEDVHSYVADGVAVHNCMMWSAYRDDKKQFLVEQSWGANTPDGPRPGPDGTQIPNNAFWIDWDVANRMLSQQDSFALSAFGGFKLRNIDWMSIA